MLILAAMLSINIDLTALFSRGPKVEPTVTCHITTTSHRFVGAPGATFRYDGDTFRIPARGWIELVARPKATSFEVAGRDLPLNVFPRDSFGTETVQVPNLTE
jgi:hypothetical protein